MEPAPSCRFWASKNSWRVASCAGRREGTYIAVVAGPIGIALMTKLGVIGRVFFGLAVVSLGLEHFVLGDFIIGRAPAWPESVPGGMAWAWATGSFFGAVGISILLNAEARPAAVGAALLVFLWAVLRHIPVVATGAVLSGEWTNAGKALVFVGGFLAVNTVLPTAKFERPRGLAQMLNESIGYVTTCRLCLGLFLAMTGVQHFIYTEFVAGLIPVWFPGDAEVWTYFAGVALISGGLGLLIPYTARWAALLSGLMVFCWFWIVHLPRVMVSVSDGIAIFEALAVSGIAFVLAARLGIGRPAVCRPEPA